MNFIKKLVLITLCMSIESMYAMSIGRKFLPILFSSCLQIKSKNNVKLLQKSYYTLPTFIIHSVDNIFLKHPFVTYNSNVEYRAEYKNRKKLKHMLDGQSTENINLIESVYMQNNYEMTRSELTETLQEWKHQSNLEDFIPSAKSEI